MKFLILVLLLLLAGPVSAQEDKLIGILRSDASIKDKTDACRELARVGTRQSVPVLALLLGDEQLSSMARYALEPIADPAVDVALRAALRQVQGRLLAGVIYSLGVRKDAQAIEPIARCLADPDPVVAQTAARVLGRLGPGAAPALVKALSGATPGNLPAICDGLFRCAEGMSGAEATAIYDQVRALPNVPLNVRIAAWTGAIRSRGDAGLPLLADAIRGQTPLPPAHAVRIAMDLPGTEVTKTLVRQVGTADPETQVLLIQALGYRADPISTRALVALAQNGSARKRVAALRALVQLGETSALPVLVGAIKDPELAVSSAAQTGLFAFPGKDADAAVVGLLKQPEAKIRVAAIEALSQRRITAATPLLINAATDPDATVASASFKSLGDLADVSDVPGIIDTLPRTKAMTAGEAALATICSRQPSPTACVDQLVSALAQAQGESKLALIRVLGAVGGAPALTAVRTAMSEADPAVKETALRMLCDWATADVLPDLAGISRTAAEPRFKLLALRGQLRLIPTQTIPDAQKLAQLKEILPLLAQAEEQRVALAILGEIRTAESLALVGPFLANGELKEEAALAALSIGEKIVAAEPEAVLKAMSRVQTGNDQVAGRVRKLQEQARKTSAGQGFVPLFNGKDLAGWDGKPGWWTVEDGALTAESTAEKPCKECNYLVWRGGRPADFELRADFKLSRSANSGIQLRSEELANWDTSGYQADMTGDGELVGFVYHHKRGLIAGRGEKAVFAADGKKSTTSLGEPAALLKHFKEGDWNTYRVVCRGPEIALYVNDVLMCQIADHHATEAAARGIIALQMHPGPPMKVQFKNIRLKELK